MTDTLIGLVSFFVVFFVTLYCTGCFRGDTK